MPRGPGGRRRFVERKGDVYLLASPALLAMAIKLDSVGIDLETAAAASGIRRKHLRRAVTDLVHLFVDQIQDGQVPIDNARDLFQTFRVVGVESVRILFAREMEGEVRKLLASGRLGSLSARARKKKR